MESLAGLEDRLKSFLEQVFEDEGVQRAVRLYRQFKAESAQQVQQQLSQVNLLQPNWIQPPVEASVPFAIEALCCGREQPRIQAPRACCSRPCPTCLLKTPFLPPGCSPPLQQQPQAGNITNQYWAQLTGYRNEYLEDLENFYEVPPPLPPNLPSRCLLLLPCPDNMLQ